MTNGRCTIYDIAKEAGVSIATVSRVLRGENSVTEKTRKKVEGVILRLNYQPSAIARGLTLRHSKTFGIVLPRIENPHYALFFNGAYHEAMQAGYIVSLFPWETMQESEQSLSDILAERRLDGAIYCMEYADDADFDKQKRILEAVSNFMPVVLIGSNTLGAQYPSVTVDLRECVLNAMEYLVEYGHERIALIGGLQEKDGLSARDEGYRYALQRARLPFISDYRAFCRCTAEEGERSMSEMLDALIPSQWPTAVVAANDMVALGVISAIRARGKRVPEDFSVIGCDNLFFGSFVTPALTSIDIKQEYIGRRAVQMLLNENARGNERVESEIVKRASCARVNRAGEHGK